MAAFAFGRTLVIANPAAQSGRGAQGARTVEHVLSSGELPGRPCAFEMRLTAGPGDATRIAAAAAGFDTVVALGGDGVIHEVVNGLMSVARAERPRLAVVPLGSGNDYARTLGMPRNRPEQALHAIARGTVAPFDLGCVNGTYFAQTLSFGLDAAIALGTMARRTKNGAHGTRLFAREGIDVFTRNRTPFSFRATLRGPGKTVETVAGEALLFAVQVGPTYGGGFRICPAASAHDGLLDVCRTTQVPSIPRTLTLFALARLGLHAHSRAVRFEQVTGLVVDFADEPPCQADGERLEGRHFEISCIPGALEVAVAR